MIQIILSLASNLAHWKKICYQNIKKLEQIHSFYKIIKRKIYENECHVISMKINNYNEL